MSYGGLCSPDNYVPNVRDLYYGVGAYDRITPTPSAQRRLRQRGHRQQPPTVNAGVDRVIPPHPVRAHRRRVGPDGDALTYCWEQRDVSTQFPLSAATPQRPDHPLVPPRHQPFRTVPNLVNLLANTSTPARSCPPPAAP